jgi:tetratricopeptide (TPR) repeat protein
MKKAGLFFFVTVCIFFTALQTSAQNDSIRFIQAHKAALIGQFNTALPLFTRIVTHSPQMEKAWRERGSCYLDLGNYKEAMSDYNMAIKLDSTDGLAYENRGILYSLKKMRTEALADFSRAIKLDSSCISAYCSSGSLLNGMKRYEEAEHFYNLAIVHAPEQDKAECYCSLGYTCMQKGEYQKSVDHLSKAIELRPSYAEAYKYRADCYFDLENYQAYENDIVKLRKMDKKPAKKDWSRQ